MKKIEYGYNTLIKIYLDTKGMALFVVIGLMVVLFLLGTAALTSTNIESKINQNYIQSVQAFYDCEAGIAEAMARINNDTLNLDQWKQAADSDLFHYNYYVSYDANQSLYQVISEGKDPTQTANRRIIAEISSPCAPSDISTPAYCGTGEIKGQANGINGNSSCPGWADDGDPNNDQSVSCISTSRSYVSDTDPIDFDPNQLITSNPYQITYNTPEINVNSWANYYQNLPPDFTSIPTGGSVTIGASNDLKVVYINGSQTISEDKTGYGVLVVTGDLHISGQLNWNGIVIVLGNFQTLSGGGTVTGAILTPNNFDMHGSAQIQWCGDVIRKVIDEIGKPSLQIVSWKED